MLLIRKPRFSPRWLFIAQAISASTSCCLFLPLQILSVDYRNSLYGEQRIERAVIGQNEILYLPIYRNINFVGRLSSWWTLRAVANETGLGGRLAVLGRSVETLSSFDITPGDGALKGAASSLGTLCLEPSNGIAVSTAANMSSFQTLASNSEAAMSITPTRNELSRFLPFFVFFTATVSLLHIWSIRNVLRPTKHFIEGLNCLACGDLSYRMPKFRRFEFQCISNAFNLLAAQLDQKSRHEDTLTASLIDRLEQERVQLARELHDELAQTSAGMSAIIESVKVTAEAECPKLLHEANKLLNISASMQKKIGATLRNLSLPQIDDIGLSESLSALAKGQENYSGRGLRISLEICGNLCEIPRGPAAHIYRIVQEGLTNVIKHADANQARVCLKYHRTTASQMAWLVITIEDNGSGSRKPSAAANTGVGLIGMRERVNALGGRLKVSAKSTTGFRICASIPFRDYLDGSNEAKERTRTNCRRPRCGSRGLQNAVNKM